MTPLKPTMGSEPLSRVDWICRTATLWGPGLVTEETVTLGASDKNSKVLATNLGVLLAGFRDFNFCGFLYEL